MHVNSERYFGQFTAQYAYIYIIYIFEIKLISFILV